MVNEKVAQMVNDEIMNKKINELKEAIGLFDETPDDGKTAIYSRIEELTNQFNPRTIESLKNFRNTGGEIMTSSSMEDLIEFASRNKTVKNALEYDPEALFSSWRFLINRYMFMRIEDDEELARFIRNDLGIQFPYKKFFKLSKKKVTYDLFNKDIETRIDRGLKYCVTFSGYDFYAVRPEFEYKQLTISIFCLTSKGTILKQTINDEIMEIITQAGWIQDQ